MRIFLLPGAEESMTRSYKEALLQYIDVKKKGYSLFLGEYHIYFIECDENISKFTSM